MDAAVGDRIDPRRARTHEAIMESLEKLSADDVVLTVPAILDTAGVSRSTFYARYDGLEGLLTDTLAHIFGEIADLDLTLRATVTPAKTAQATTRALVDAFARRRALCRGVFRSDARAAVFESLLASFARFAEPTMAIAAPEGIDPQRAARYVAGGTLTVLIDWVLDDKPTSSDRVQEQIFALLPGWMLNKEGNYSHDS